jgi:hypothetical protein
MHSTRTASAFLIPVMAIMNLSCATVAGSIGASLAGSEARKVIESARAAASKLLAEGTNSGNALLIRSGNELNVFADNASRILGAEIDKKLDRVSEENRKLLVELHGATEAVRRLESTVYNLKDAVALDLQEVAGRLPFTQTDKQFIQRIEGVTQLQQDSREFVLSAWAHRFGTDSESLQTSFSLIVDGEAVSARVERIEAHRATFFIPPQALKSKFKDDRFVLVSATLKVKRVFQEGWVFSKQRTLEFDVPFKVTLLPRKAGKMSLKLTHPRYDWVERSTERATRSTGDHHCNSNCRGEPTLTNYSVALKVTGTGRTPPVLGDQRLSEASLNCIAGPCAFSRVNTVYLSESDTRATGEFAVWSKPTTWELSARRFEYSDVGTQETVLNFDVEYGKSTSVVIPNDTMVGQVTGRLITGVEVDLVVGATSSIGPLTLARDTHGEPGQRILVFALALPAGIVN